MNQPNNRFSGLLRYQQKVFGLGDLFQEYDQVRPGKQTNDAKIMFGIYSGLVAGKTSLNELAKHTDVSRSVLESLLNLEGLGARLRKYVKSMIKCMKRGKMIQLDHVQGKYLASVDGVETTRYKLFPDDFYNAVRQGIIGKQCQVAVHKDAKTDSIDYYEIYHRVVVVCMITTRGPFPIAWAYQQSTVGDAYKKWLEDGAVAKDHPASNSSAEKAKQEGELTVFKQLLQEIKDGNGGKLPFDIIVGDGLYDKATVLEEVERAGAALIAVQKDERRSIRGTAEEDFTTRIPDKTWDEMQRHFEGWSGSFIDQNINRKDQQVKIIRVIRRHKDGTTVDNYFYASNKAWITPRLTEWCRHYRWKEENGFNAWTNQWDLLKHTFHNTAEACDAMMGFIFIAIIGVVNYRLGNLQRGGRKLTETFKEFIISVIVGFQNVKTTFRDYLNSCSDHFNTA